MNPWLLITLVLAGIIFGIDYLLRKKKWENNTKEEKISLLVNMFSAGLYAFLSAVPEVRKRLLADIGVDLGDNFAENIDHGIELFIGDVESAQAAHNGTVTAAFFHDEFVLETLFLNQSGNFTGSRKRTDGIRGTVGIDEFATGHQTFAADIAVIAPSP